MATSRQEIVRAAIQLERDGRQFYLDVAEKASSALAKQMFESLADDEVRHIEWIEKLYPGVKSVEEINKGLYQRLSKVFADMPEETRRGAQLAESDADAINLAIQMEVKSRDTYRQWGEESDDEEVQTLCKALAGAEEYHKELLENTREYLSNSIDWFLQDRGVVELG
jgi:rubrerythrin